MKKLIALILCAAMVFGMVGCAATPSNNGNDGSGNNSVSNEDRDTSKDVEVSKDSPVTAPGELPIVSEEVTLSCLMVMDYPNVDYSIENNEVLQWILEETGVNLEIEYVNKADAPVRIQTLFTSGEYPDFIWNGNMTIEDGVKYGFEEGMLIPLNSLIDEYSYWFNDCLEEMPNLFAALTCEDGNIYGLPNCEVSYHVTNPAKMWINYDWLEALDLEVPTTTDEYYEVLKAFKTQDPNGNGKADEIPLSGSLPGWNSDPTQFILQAFAPYNNLQDDTSPYLYVDNGAIKSVATQEDYREGLRYMNKLWEEGLIDKSAFTQTMEDIVRVGSGETKLLGSMPGGHLGVAIDIANPENEAPYKGLAPLVGPEGRQSSAYNMQGVGTNIHFAITDKCEYPEVAFRLIDFMFYWKSDLNLHYGMEGTAWEALPEDTDLVNPSGEKALAKTKDSQFSATDLQTNILYLRPSYMGAGHNTGWWAAEGSIDTWNHNSNIVWVLEYYTNYYKPYQNYDEAIGPLSYTAEESEELAQIRLSIKTYLDDARIKFITGELDLDADWDAYVKEAESSEMSRYIELVQAGYTRTYPNGK